MKRFLKIRIPLFAAALVMIAVLCGCTKSGNDIFIYSVSNENGSEKVSLTFFGYKADAMNLTATEEAMQSFMAQHEDISVSYEGIKGTAYWDAFDKRDAAGVLDDVLMMNHDHIISMTAKGQLADLSGLPGIENFSDKAKVQFIGDDGSVYFLPMSISTYNLYINYDLLKASGLEVPENWNDFKNCCDYFVKTGVVPIVANNRNSLSTLILCRGLFDTYQQQDVAGLLESYNKDPSLLAKAIYPGVELAAEILERGWFDKAETIATEQTSDDLELFAKGDRPFMITGGWASTRLAAMEPGFSYGVHPYPLLEDGCVLCFQVDTCISINAASPRLEEAKEFVRHLIQPDVMWKFCDSQASYTPLNDTRLPSEKTLIPSTEYLSNGRVVFRNDYRLYLPVETALMECASVMLNGGSAEEAKSTLLRVLTE